MMKINPTILCLIMTILLAMPCFLDSFAPSTIPIHNQRCNLQIQTANCLFMGKGDGKKKRKKKSTSGSISTSSSSASSPESHSSSSSHSPPPLRVTNSINIPIKRQIQWAKLNQEIKNSGTSFRQPRKRTAYRKQIDEDSHAEMLDVKRLRNSHVDWEVILNNGNGTNAGPLMLVDGYNVIYQWSRLKKHMLKGNTAMARDLLVRDLEDLHYAKGWRIECVFDGFGRKAGGSAHFDGPGTDKVPLLERSTKISDTGRGVRVCYSGIGASADSYIEQRCLDARDVTKGKLTGSLIVVSNDAMIKLVGTSAGALCMSSDRFVDELRAVKKITQYRVEAAMAMVNGGSVRPESLRGIGGSSMQSAPFIRMQGSQGAGVSEEIDGVQVVNTLRGGQFVIEDKRLRRRSRKTRGLDSLTETTTISEVTSSSSPLPLFDKDDDR